MRCLETRSSIHIKLPGACAVDTGYGRGMLLERRRVVVGFIERKQYIYTLHNAVVPQTNENVIIIYLKVKKTTKRNKKTTVNMAL